MQADAKRKVHLHIAAGVEQHFPELPREQPDVLAFHWECAGDPSKAVGYWKQAAQRSSMASAHDETLAQLERALQLLPRTSTGETDAARAELLLTRGATLIGKRGFGHPDVGEAFQTVAKLVSVETGIPQLAFAARWGLWYFRNCRAELLEAQALAEELETIAERASDRDLQVSASEASCETAFCMGRHHDSIAAGRRCETLYDFDRHRHLAASRGDDPLLASLSFEAMAQLTVGHHALAVDQVEQALALAERLGYTSLTAGMHAQAAWVYLIRGSSGATEPDLTTARRHTARAMALASEHGFPFWEVYALMIDAAARIAGGDTSALAELQQGANAWLGAGAGLGRSWHLTFIGQAQRLDGKHREALSTFDEALQFCDRTEERYFEPEIRRQRAEVLLDGINPERDENAALHELAIAHERANAMDAKWWSLAITVTTIRHRAREFPGDLTTLEQLLQQLGPVPQGDLPPLVREARALLRQ
jgi:tetratricopeptide (TPR) repeat protein